MNVSPLQPRVNAAELPLEQLAANSRVSDQQKIGELSRQFEAVFLRQMLREAQQPVFASEFTTGSMARDVYQDMVTDRLADSISRSGTFGLAAGLNRELTRQLTAKSATPQSATDPLP